jgi:hypothetical protein
MVVDGRREGGTMVVLFIIMLSGILLFFLVKPPSLELEEEVILENDSSVDLTDLTIPDMAYINRVDV